MNRKAFTLIELLIAMALLAILALLLVGNLNMTLKRGRDSQRKSDLSQYQKALEIYYEDRKTYPTFDVVNTSYKKLCITEDCSSPSETFYMLKTPQDPSTGYTYTYVPAPTPSGGGPATSYYLYSYLENTQDAGSTISQTGFTSGAKCDAAKTTTNCKYYVSSSNAPVLTPNP